MSNFRRVSGVIYTLHVSSGFRDEDVRCGIGSSGFRNAGNVLFRHLVNLNKEEYQTTSDGMIRRQIAVSIISAIKGQTPPGRFLEKNFASGLWCVISDKRAIAKTTQALREPAPKFQQHSSRDNTHPRNVSAGFRDEDVRCGHGASEFRNAGNLLFRHLIDRKKEIYQSTTDGMLRRQIISTVFLAIKGQNPPGRFLEKNIVSGSWCVISEEQAIAKISKALGEMRKYGSDTESIAECVGSADESVAECDVSSDESVAECVGSADYSTTECDVSSDESDAECVGSADIALPNAMYVPTKALQNVL